MKRTLYPKLLGGYLIYGLICFIIISTFGYHITFNFLERRDASTLYRESALISSNYAENYFKRSTTLEEMKTQLSTLSTYLSSEIWIIDKQGQILLNTASATSPVENAEPEVTESGDTGQEVAEQETPASEENRSGENTAKEQETVALPHPQIDLSQAKLADFDYVMNQFFILDSNTETNAQQISAPRFLKEDLSVKKDSSVPQILIYHTHSQEAFADSREGQTEDTIVGVGDHLTELLEKIYGYQVLHITDPFDMMGGTLDRSKAYDYARASIEKVLEENPTIEVVIDLHRDGVPDDRHLVTQVNGKPTAQLLFYNGLSYTVSQGAVSYLPNPYIEENLAFSFQLEYQAAQYYPDLYRGIYLAGLRYNLHLKPRALLLEAGAQTNTVEEVRNAMEPFADILNRVLKGSDKED